MQGSTDSVGPPTPTHAQTHGTVGRTQPPTHPTTHLHALLCVAAWADDEPDEVVAGVLVDGDVDLVAELARPAGHRVTHTRRRGHTAGTGTRAVRTDRHNTPLGCCWPFCSSSPRLHGHHPHHNWVGSLRARAAICDSRQGQPMLCAHPPPPCQLKTPVPPVVCWWFVVRVVFDDVLNQPVASVHQLLPRPGGSSAQHGTA